MKKLVWVLISVAVLATGGYYMLWQAQATIARDQVVEVLKSANQHHPFITYESVEPTGFPLAVGVSINKPVIDLPVSTFIQPFAATMPTAPDGTDMANIRKSLLSLPNWQEKLVLDGRIVITIDALSNTYHIQPEGHYSGTSYVGQESWEYAIATSGTRGCDIAFNDSIASESFANLWNWQILSQEPEKLIKNLKRFDCNIPDYEYINKTSGKKMLLVKAAKLFFANNSANGMIDMALDINIPSMQGTEAYDALAEKYFQLLYKEPLPEHYRLSIHGDQSMRVKGSLNMHEQEPNQHPMRIVVDEFSFHSDIADTDYRLNLAFNPTGDMSGDGEIYNKMTFSGNEQAYKLYLAQAKQIADDIYEPMKAAGNISVSKGELTSALQQVVPKLHELGQIIYEVDIKGNAQEGGKADIALNNIEIGTTPYGLKANGSLNIASMMIPMPTGAVDVTCRACELLVTNVVDWFGRLKPLLAMTEDAEEYAPLMALDEQDAATRLTRFLRKIDPKGAENLNFAVKFEANPTINGLDTAKLIAIFNEELAPLFVQPAQEVSE